LEAAIPASPRLDATAPVKRERPPDPELDAATEVAPKRIRRMRHARRRKAHDPKTSKKYWKAWAASIFHAAAENSARVAGEEVHAARRVPKDLVGKVECVFTGHDEEHEEAGRLISDCPVYFEWRYHCKAPATAYDIRGVCTTRLLANSVAYFPDRPIRPPLGIMNACSAAYVMKTLPLKRPRCAIFDGTPDRGKKIEIVALGLPKDLRSLPAEGTLVRT